MGGTPKSSMLIGFSIINHPAIGPPTFMETPTVHELAGSKMCQEKSPCYLLLVYAYHGLCRDPQISPRKRVDCY